MFRGSEQATALVEELVGRANLAMVNALNIAARAIYEESQKRVPKERQAEHTARARRGGSYPEEQLVNSGRVIYATVDDHVAQIVYNSPYAGAQEAGVTTYQSKRGKEVEWKARHYTTPGTGAHYLADSGKITAPQIPEELAIQGRIAFGILPGLKVSKSTLTTSGRRVEAEAMEGGPVAQIEVVEQRKAETATSVQTPTPRFPPILQ